MSNVFGRVSIEGATYPIVVPLVTSTSTETRLSLDGSASPQNQTRDPKKVMVIKTPTSGSPGILVLSLNRSLYGSPLAFVADLPLSNELSTAVHKSLAVQFSYTQAEPIAAGSIFVLGDSLKLQAETATDPKSSTYTMNLLLPTAAVSVTNYTITLVKNPSLNVFISKIFDWDSLDTPDNILTKWHATMRPTIDSYNQQSCSKARRNENSDLFGHYNYGDIDVVLQCVDDGTFLVKGDLIESANNNIIPFFRFVADEQTLRVVNCDDEQEILDECESLRSELYRNAFDTFGHYAVLSVLFDSTPKVGLNASFVGFKPSEFLLGSVPTLRLTAKETRYMGEGVEHRTEKARQFGLARAVGQEAIEEYPVGDGRYIADLAVFDTIDEVGGVGGNLKLVKVVEVVIYRPVIRVCGSTIAYTQKPPTERPWMC
ncbi:hypothetical protein T492DRAFT_1125114 [Pavlovales sp. CCMP2436]|nr:hypothetical protein T492DRAFT_1125114 [Pavlovales sp. CCMP2436]